MLRARLAAVRAEIAEAAMRVGRDPTSIRLVAVTKTQPPDVVAAVVRAGVTEIGENYLQPAAETFTALGWPSADGGAPVIRHFIGHLQANKVRKALTWFEMIETIDSLRLAERVEAVAGTLGRKISVLLQVNVSGEATKSGFFPQELAGILPALANLSHIRVEGLMTIGRFDPDPEAARAEFRALRDLRDALRIGAPSTIGLDALSMGMSHDFPVAIAEGATMVRVGTRLFGPRHAQH